MVSESPPSPVGALLKQWRERRRMSQLGLAIEAEISSRHLSFVETGRSRPSREMVLLLAGLTFRSALTTTFSRSGVRPSIASGLDAPEMVQFRRALTSCYGSRPYPAIVLDRHWNILLANGGLTGSSDSCWTRW
jgi:transcriptional regulator with XRE-family HTH domain